MEPVVSTGMPRSAKAARVIFFIGAALAIVVLIAVIVRGGSATQVGYVVGATLPEYLALVVAFGMSSRKRVWWVLGLVAVILWALGGLATIGRGDPSGVLQLALPVTALVLWLQPTARAYYAKKVA